MKTLILYYDSYHTPLDSICERLPNRDLVVLHVRLDDDDQEPPAAGSESYCLDARERFADCYLARAIKANACYQDGYYLSAALSRPLLAEICVEQALKLGADTIVHGFAGNDHLRFSAGVRSLAPSLAVINVRDICGSRTAANAAAYTISSNLWGSSIESGSLSDPSCPPSAKIWPDGSSSDAERHEISFESGVPAELDGCRLSLALLISQLNCVGRRFMIGRTDLVEHGYVGLKTRAVYDAPAASILIHAHHDLEHYVSSRRQARFKRLVDAEWTELVYDGCWFDPARLTCERYIDHVNERVTGAVEVELLSGGERVLSRRSPFALYDERRAVYRAGQDFGSHLIEELAVQHSLAAITGAGLECPQR